MRSSCLLLSLICLSSAAAAGAQSLDPGKRLTRYAPERWGDEDGLPGAYIWDIAQTADGYLWLATGDGLVRFDGVRFTVFDSVETPALSTDEVFSLSAGSDGRLWIGASDGSIVVRDGRGLTRLVDWQAPAQDGVMAIFEDRDGDLWAWRDLSGLARYRFSGARLADAGLPPALADVDFPPQQAPRRSIVQDREGRLWLASQGGGLYVLAGDALRRLTTADGLADDFVHTVAEDPEGGLWIATEGGLDRYRDGTLSPMSSALGLPAGVVAALAVDRAGALWIGKRPVFRWAVGRLERLESTEEIPGNQCLHRDREGSLWIGSANDGLFRLRDDGSTPLGPPEGFPDSVVLAVYEDRAGRLRLGTARAGLVTLDGGEMTRMTTADGLPHDFIWSIHEPWGRDGEMWLGTDGGLVRLEGGVVTRVYTTADGLSDDRVRVVTEDPQEPGTLWLGTIDGGVSRLRNNTFSRWTRADGLQSDNVRWLHKDRGGGLWIGLQNGLQRLSAAGELETFTLEDGLASTRMRAVYEDAGGTLWVGTSGGGLSRFRDGRFVSYTRKDGLTCDDVWGILEDDEGGLWLTGGCAGRVPKEDFDAYDQGRIPRLGIEDQLGYAFDRTRCCTAGGFPAGWKGRDGRLWFPGAPGLVVVDPRRQTAGEPPAPIIESLSVDGEAAALAGARVPPGSKSVEIRYTAPMLSAAERLSFRYRLAGLEDDWVLAGPRRVAYYSSLPPGGYRFQVAARAASGEWQPAAAAMALRVEAFWWQTVWFRAAAALALFAAVAIAYRHRMGRIAERNRRLVAEVEERERAAAALRAEIEDRERAEQALGEIRAQLAHVGRLTTMGELTAAIAHQLKQPLTAVAANAYTAKSFLAAGEPEELGEILDDIDADNRRAVEIIDRLRALMKKDELRLERVDVNRAVAEVSELLRGEAVLREVAVETRLEPGLPPVEADRIQLQQVLMNLIQNAIGAMEKTPAADRRLVVRTAPDAGPAVRISVSDGGAGFGGRQPEDLFEPFHSTRTGGLGMGLAICRTIVEAHGGRIWGRENPDRGATFHFTLPIDRTAEG